MKDNLISILAVGAMLFTATIFQACSGSKTVIEQAAAESNCTHRGVFRSFQSSPNCQFLLVLNDGTKLQPVGSLPDGLRMSDGMEVMVDYELADGLESACRATDKVVRITCMDVLVFPELECANKSTVFNREWMKDAIQFFNPKQIRYLETDSLNYFQLRGDQWIIFDCLGKARCFGVEHTTGSQCGLLIEELKNNEVIWTLNY
ncbi:MAG: hypothetical protein EA409_12630 [Saprospirales bacterium]|nr:MAG: hypothetical protein EA409_12630 [Saprospirales bacterium]